MNILLVEDDDGDAMLIARSLKEQDKTVDVLRAYDGGDALSILANLDQAPDLILLDLNMPGVNGHQTLERIRAQKEHELTPIVVFTTSAAERDIQMAYKNRANAYVQKPSSLGAFQQVVGSMKSFWENVAKVRGGFGYA